MMRSGAVESRAGSKARFVMAGERFWRWFKESVCSCVCVCSSRMFYIVVAVSHWKKQI